MAWVRQELGGETSGQGMADRDDSEVSTLTLHAEGGHFTTEFEPTNKLESEDYQHAAAMALGEGQNGVGVRLVGGDGSVQHDGGSGGGGAGGGGSGGGGAGGGGQYVGNGAEAEAVGGEAPAGRQFDEAGGALPAPSAPPTTPALPNCWAASRQPVRPSPFLALPSSLAGPVRGSRLAGNGAEERAIGGEAPAGRQPDEAGGALPAPSTPPTMPAPPNCWAASRQPVRPSPFPALPSSLAGPMRASSLGMNPPTPAIALGPPAKRVKRAETVVQLRAAPPPQVPMEGLGRKAWSEWLRWLSEFEAWRAAKDDWLPPIADIGGGRPLNVDWKLADAPEPGLATEARHHLAIAQGDLMFYNDDSRLAGEYEVASVLLCIVAELQWRAEQLPETTAHVLARTTCHVMTAPGYRHRLNTIVGKKAGTKKPTWDMACLDCHRAADWAPPALRLIVLEV